MVYSTPRTWTVSEYPTAAELNSNVRDNVSFLANPPACRATGTTTSIAHATTTAVPFATEDYDTNAMHDTVTNNSRVTIKTAGLYVVTANLAWPTNGTGYRWAGIVLNNATDIAIDSKSAASVSSDLGHALAITRKFAVNDYLELKCRQESGGSLALSGNTPVNLAATWIGLG